MFFAANRKKMTVKELIKLRLFSQQGASPMFSNPSEVVEWMGAVQAQDYFGSLWAVGLRCKNVCESDIEQTIAAKKIIRSWPMRGTLHFVAHQTLRWMLKYLTPRVVTRVASVYKQAELDGKVFKKSAKLLTKALQSQKQLTRGALYEILEKGGIATGNYRGLHILGYLAQEGLICLATRLGKQPSFALLDEWVEPAPMIGKEEAFSKLCAIYFRSHGPALTEDFMWWSGLTKKEAEIAIEENKSSLSEARIANRTFYFREGEQQAGKIPQVILIPAFDEYTVGYSDRTAVGDPATLKKSGFGLSPSLVIKGEIAGTWKRILSKNHVTVEIRPFGKISSAEKEVIASQVKRYGKFIGTESVMKIK